jgi:hypothetical protein
VRDRIDALQIERFNAKSLASFLTSYLKACRVSEELAP